ncbi:hypothetical protein T492DRAFT_858991, partial [Pavlovales sp. CCMP2436]
SAEGTSSVYAHFDLIVRRKPQENNFKAVLACIRDLVGSPVSLPLWLHDVLLGYGDPSAASYSSLLLADADAKLANPGAEDDEMQGVVAVARQGAAEDAVGAGSREVDVFDTFVDETHVVQ